MARTVRVLIVEDDPAIQNAYEFVLQKSGFEVYTADNGQEALAQLVHVPDIILLDMLMPGYSGLDFLREAELPERYPRIQVVAVSNIDSPRVKEDAKNYGVVRYVLKVEMTPRDIAHMVTELAAEQKPVRSDVSVD